MVATVVGSALAIGLTVHAGLVDLAVYRGLSGIDSALFALVMTQMLVGARGRGDRGP